MKKTQRKRRSDFRIMTMEAKVLKYLRESKKKSIRTTARKTGLSPSFVNHAENGRLDLRPSIILKLLNYYEYSYEEFMELVSVKKELPTNLYNEQQWKEC